MNRWNPKAASARPTPLDEMPGLDSHLCFALYSASNHMTRIFTPFLTKLGVTYPQYLVLGPVGIHREAITAAAMWIMAGEGLLGFSAGQAVRLDSFELAEKVSVRCR